MIIWKKRIAIIIAFLLNKLIQQHRHHRVIFRHLKKLMMDKSKIELKIFSKL